LRRAAFEQQRIHHHVEEQRNFGQHAGEDIHKQGEHDERGDAEQAAKQQRAEGRQLPCNQRPAAGSGHELVEIPVEVAVDRPRAPGGEVTAEHSCQYQAKTGPTAGREHHRRHGSHQQ